ncbi:hypothetical protein MA16_Dca026283 [Dendrobium catenatum]|uniref:Uncharacterized protein n=1 Tax=Dendrobium catenatum TaxID=906689 RepID=A0A2I0WNU4_9ASPA|nr:hypothetical protein MA16_Dca026283 [Dendrobium catenatum]
MQRKVEVRKLSMGDMMRQMKEKKEDVKSKTEQLGVALGALLAARKKVCAAHQPGRKTFPF